MQKNIHLFYLLFSFFIFAALLVCIYFNHMNRKQVQSMNYTDWSEQQHREYLRTNERYLAFYAQHSPLSIDRFIIEYAAIKYDIFKNMEPYKHAYEQHKMQFLSDADKYIDIILQKKLFNLQCQWRAGLVKLPFVDICADFIYWQHHIRSCPFIPPITPEELDICISFLKEEIDHSEALFGEYIDWQNYQGYKNHRQYLRHQKSGNQRDDTVSLYESAIMPDIYIYFDKAQHTISWLDLPNVRGEKEAIYVAKGYKIKYNSLKEQLKTELDWENLNTDEAAEETSDIKPGLYAFDPLNFVEIAEDSETQEAFTYYNLQRSLGHRKEEDDETQMYFDFLKAFDEPIRIEGHNNWRTALAMSARRFKQNKIAEMLPYAYDSQAFEFNGEVDEDKILAERVARFKYNENDHYYKVLKLQKDTFLAARQVLDGKNDFNYF